MNTTQKEAIWDAVNAVTGLEGVWENQKGSVAPTTPHFALKLLFPGTPIDRKGEVIRRDDGRDTRVTRLVTTLQVKVFGQENSNMVSAHNNVLFHKHLNQVGIVCFAMLRSVDITSVYVDWETVNLYDFEIVYVREDLMQPESETDEYIEKAGISGVLGSLDLDWDIPHEE